jgi:hypothetical protein
MNQAITKKTLVPLSAVGFIAAAIFWLSDSKAKIISNEDKIESNKKMLYEMTQDASKRYIDLVQRLTRIEEAIKK